jgi:hypothetical protein
MAGLTNMPSVWGDLNLPGNNQSNLAGSNQQTLTEQQELERKKKIMSAGSASQFLSATQLVMGSKTGLSGSVM